MRFQKSRDGALTRALRCHTIGIQTWLCRGAIVGKLLKTPMVVGLWTRFFPHRRVALMATEVL